MNKRVLTPANLANTIRGYAKLRDGWDGDDDHAPAQEDIKNAVLFIANIPTTALSSADLMIAGDGDVGFS